MIFVVSWLKPVSQKKNALAEKTLIVQMVISVVVTLAPKGTAKKNHVTWKNFASYIQIALVENVVTITVCLPLLSVVLLQLMIP